MTDDELDALLTPKAPTANDALREAIFATTLPLRRPRRIGKYFIAVGLFAVGIAVGWFAKPTPPPERVVETVTVLEKVSEPVPAEVPSPSEPLVEFAPERLELEAEKATDPATSAKFYQRAGDAFLKASHVDSAIRCYRLYLAESGAEGRIVRLEDSWLLTSIKNSRKKEPDRANADS